MPTFHRGRIEYRGDGGVRGHESFSISCADDGSKTLQAHCTMFDSQIERWVTQTVDRQMVPVRSFVSQNIAGKFLGEGWFVFTPGRIIARSVLGGAEHNMIEQVVNTDGELDYFVPHSVAGDAWITSRHDRTSEGWVPVSRGFTTSLLADGATGPMIEQHRTVRQRFLGAETLRVPAGEFQTLHFVISTRPGVEDHLWVTREEPSLLVQLRSDQLRTTYVLCEYEMQSVFL